MNQSTILPIGTKLEKLYPNLNPTYRQRGDLYDIVIWMGDVNGIRKREVYWTSDVDVLRQIYADFNGTWDGSNHTEGKYSNHTHISALFLNIDGEPRPEHEWHESRWMGQYIKFCPEMFIPGTQFMCEDLGSSDEKYEIHTAVSVSNNGPGSWVIRTDKKNDGISKSLNDLDRFINVSHVTSIVAPGKGKLVREKDRCDDSVARYFGANLHRDHFPNTDKVTHLLWEAKYSGELKSKRARRKFRDFMRQRATHMLERKKVVVARDKAYWDSMYQDIYLD